MLGMRKKIFLILIIILSVFSGITGLVYSYVVRIVIEGINNPYSFKYRIIISIILMALTILITYLREILIAKYIKIYNTIIRDSLFKARLNNNSKKEYISILINDVNTVENEYIKAKFDLITCIVMFVFAWGNLMMYSWIHGLIILIFAIASVSVSMILRSKARKYRVAISKNQEKYTHRVKDMLLGITVIKQFSALEHICLEHHKENENLETTKYENSKFLAKMEGISSVFSMSMFYISFLLGAFLVVRGTYTIAIMMSAIQLVNNIVSPMFEGISSINCINGSSEILNKIKLFSKINEQQSGENIGSINNIALKNISYQSENFKMNNISFEFKKGKKYAIVGKSGAGKTTLLNLISKNTDYIPKGIAINGIPIENINDSYIKKLMTYMNQEVYVFNDTIKNNILLYEDFDEETYQYIIKLAGLEKFIDSFPEKDQHMLINNGENISGGEKQRIALARVLLRDSNVILLDEAFSSLDNITAHAITLDILEFDKTVVMVVHKYAEDILKKCDEILVMDNGQVLEMGTFDYLISNNEYFKNLYYYNQEL